MPDFPKTGPTIRDWLDRVTDPDSPETFDPPIPAPGGLIDRMPPFHIPGVELHRFTREVVKGEPQTTIQAFRYGEIAGTLDVQMDTQAGWLSDLYVDPAHRRQGIARALLLDAIRLARDAGCGACALRVFADNADALRLYEAMLFFVAVVEDGGKSWLMVLPPDAGPKAPAPGRTFSFEATQDALPVIEPVIVPGMAEAMRLMGGPDSPEGEQR